jgi:hypothetical protein
MIGLNLYKRKCGLCKKEGISMYEPNAPVNIYCHKCWWSDNWDPKDWGREVDFSRTFLEQWKELLQEVPLLGLSIDKITGESSPYTSNTGNSKNCYMLFNSNHVEDSFFGHYLANTKQSLNSSMVMNSEFTFDDKNSFKNYNTKGIQDTSESMDCSFLKDSINCSQCFGSANLRNAKYVFFNKQLSKEAYEEKMQEIDLGSYHQYETWKKKANEHFVTKIKQPLFKDSISVNCTGNYFFDSRNCKECYEVLGTEDSKYIMFIKNRPVTDSYDYTGWGENSQRVYECATVGDRVSSVKFSHESGFGLLNVEYSKLAVGSHYNFGCVSIKKTNYCILNKQYSKEDYEKIVTKIKKHMCDMPYVDSKGLVYKYGEYFPMEFSPHSYNTTFANFFFPQDNNKVLQNGLGFYQSEEKEYSITMDSLELPDHIKDTNEEILKETIGCKDCKKGYRFTKGELDLSKRMNVPLSRKCPFCRIGEKVKIWVSQMNKFTRICNECGTSLDTHYSEENESNILCLSCYRKKIY